MHKVFALIYLVCVVILIPLANGQYDTAPRLSVETIGEVPSNGLQPFFMGSRYGRSDTKTNKKVRLAPRTDRFFMGSRYGKRNKPDREEVLCELTDGPQSVVSREVNLKRHVTVTCVYAGINNLYRCYNRIKPSPEPF